MLTHEIQNKENEVKNNKLPVYNMTAKNHHKIQIPYTMHPEQEQIPESPFADTGLRYHDVLKQNHVRSDVVQGEFVKAFFNGEVYMKKIRELLKNEDRYETYEDVIAAIDEAEDEKEAETEGYGKLIKDEEGTAKHKHDIMRFDILINLYEHLEKEKLEGPEFTHYLMFEEDIEENSVINSQNTNLLSAIDCKKIKWKGENVLFIESFVSLAPNTGIELLQEVLSAQGQETTRVALGAYRDSYNYYEKLGFNAALGYYSGEGKAEIMDEEQALNFIKLEGKNDSIQEALKNDELYPIYEAEIATVLKKIKERKKEK